MTVALQPVLVALVASGRYPSKLYRGKHIDKGRQTDFLQEIARSGKNVSFFAPSPIAEFIKGLRHTNHNPARGYVGTLNYTNEAEGKSAYVRGSIPLANAGRILSPVQTWLWVHCEYEMEMYILERMAKSMHLVENAVDADLCYITCDKETDKVDKHRKLPYSFPQLMHRPR